MRHQDQFFWQDVLKQHQLPSAALSLQRATGGSIHRCWVLQVGSERYFGKQIAASAAAMLRTEAHSLEALRACPAWRVPLVLGQGEWQDQAYLLLEYVPMVPLRQQARWGEALAQAHALLGPHYGWVEDNWLGTRPQANPAMQAWADFWLVARWEPQIEALTQRGQHSLAEAMREQRSSLARKLRHQPPPSLLHGDLWAGNAASLADGTPVVFDPACYWGDAETDLAMTRLFGGFEPEFYAAYHALRPKQEQQAVRQTLYTLYQQINHVLLFGQPYVHEAERLLRQWARQAE